MPNGGLSAGGGGPVAAARTSTPRAAKWLASLQPEALESPLERGEARRGERHERRRKTDGDGERGGRGGARERCDEREGQVMTGNPSRSTRRRRRRKRLMTLSPLHIRHTMLLHLYPPPPRSFAAHPLAPSHPRPRRLWRSPVRSGCPGLATLVVEGTTTWSM